MNDNTLPKTVYYIKLRWIVIYTILLLENYEYMSIMVISSWLIIKCRENKQGKKSKKDKEKCRKMRSKEIQ